MDSVAPRWEKCLRFAAAHVALEQSAHGEGLVHCLADFPEHGLLAFRQVKGKCLQERRNESVAVMTGGRLGLLDESEPSFLKAELELGQLFPGEKPGGRLRAGSIRREVELSNGRFPGQASWPMNVAEAIGEFAFERFQGIPDELP